MTNHIVHGKGDKMLVLLIGPSGVGKNTIADELIKKEPQKYRFAISVTTRKPRKDEKKGIDYYFVNKEEFEEKAENNEFYEWAEYQGNLYGTLKSEIDSDKIVFLIVEIQGAKELMKIRDIEPLSIFLLPPSYEILEERLKKRGTESDEEIVSRIMHARVEMREANKFDVKVTNDNLQMAISQIENLIKSWDV